MAFRDFRDWMKKIEKAGLLKRISAKVDWDLEMGAIIRRVIDQEGPAILFENIKDYQKTTCNKVFMNGMGTREMVAFGLGLPRQSSYRDMVVYIKDKLSQNIDPIKVKT